MAHKLLDLSKTTWEKLKKDHNVKSKGKLLAILTKATGINVGDKIDKFVAAHKIAEKTPATSTVAKLITASKALADALTKYAKQKEFATDEAKVFKKAVEVWAAEANGYYTDAVQFAARHKDELAANQVAHMINALKECDLI